MLFMPADDDSFSLSIKALIPADDIIIGGMMALDNERGNATSPRPPSVKTEMKKSFNAVAFSHSTMGSLLLSVSDRAWE